MSEETFVHESATVEAGAELGEGCRIWRFCHVMSGARLGRAVVLGQNGFVASGVVIGDRTRIQNNVSIYAGVEIGAGVFVGPSVVFTKVRRRRADFPREDAFETRRVGSGAGLGSNDTIVCGREIGE
ncbi:MAG: N-acetyltransferase, partial [Planctomycetes bacterium]|nr:N-acetyltransferase [Planctomycetota bacterium]